MTTQREADRERIAEEMNKGNDRAWSAWEFTSLDCAIRAFETLCEPRGWFLGKHAVARKWNAVCLHGGYMNVEPTGDHAADVCRLVCEVLDMEAKEEGR